MKRIFFLLISSLLLTASHAQLVPSIREQKNQPVYHHGFYLSMAIGPAFGNINGSAGTTDVYKVKGFAPGLDIQIGGAIAENLVLHGTLQVKTIIGPKINGIKLNSRYSFDENFLGAGITKYTTDNFFATANIGAAYYSFTLQNNNSVVSNKSSTDPGFSFNIKAGKEWLVSPKWGLGAALFFGRSAVTSSNGGVAGATGKEKWSGSRFGIYFQATLNKTRSK